MNSSTTPTKGDPRAEILASLQEIFESGSLGKHSRLKLLLEFLVNEELEGRGGRLKAYTIGTEIFGRSDDFNPSSDSIVRVEVGRLRQSLDHYYATDGSTAPIRIEIPKGTYRPQFNRREMPAEQSASHDQAVRTTASSSPWLPLVLLSVALLLAAAVLVGPSVSWIMVDPSGSAGQQSNAIQIVVLQTDAEEEAPSAKHFVRELRSALSRNPAFEIVGDQAGPSEVGLDFRVETTAQALGVKTRLLVEVINDHRDALVWSRTYDLESGANEDHSTVVEHVSRELRTRLLGASKEVLDGRDPSTLSAHQLFVMATWVPGPAVNALDWETQRVKYARLAIEKDPNFGPAYSVLADKLAYLAAVDGSMNSEAALDEAKRSWQRAMELSPLDANVVFNVAQGQWHSGYISDSVRSLERVIQLDPTHALASFLAMVYPYTCERASEQTLADALAFDRQLAVDDPIRWITLTWVARLHMSRKDYALALDAEAKAAQIFQSPYTTMRRAALLNLLNKPAAARSLIDAQRASWPNIDPAHFAEVTLPRKCMESEHPDELIAPYMLLAKEM